MHLKRAKSFHLCKVFWDWSIKVNTNIILLYVTVNWFHFYVEKLITLHAAYITPLLERKFRLYPEHGIALAILIYCAIKELPLASGLVVVDIINLDKIYH